MMRQRAREEEALAVRLASFSASNRALIVEYGTETTRRAKSLKRSNSSVSFLRGSGREIGHKSPSEMRVYLVVCHKSILRD